MYDHRRERAGYIRAAQVRRVSLAPAEAPELLSVVRFLRDTPGADSLGISYVAAYLKAAPAAAITAEPFDALGGMAERLARRASSRQSKQGDVVIAAHLEAVANYGVGIRSPEGGGRMQLCYDGEAFRRALAMQSTPQQRTAAALGLRAPSASIPRSAPAYARRSMSGARKCSTACSWPSWRRICAIAFTCAVRLCGQRWRSRRPARANRQCSPLSVRSTNLGWSSRQS